MTRQEKIQELNRLRWNGALVPEDGLEDWEDKDLDLCLQKALIAVARKEADQTANEAYITGDSIIAKDAKIAETRLRELEDLRDGKADIKNLRHVSEEEIGIFI